MMDLINLIYVYAYFHFYPNKGVAIAALVLFCIVAVGVLLQTIRYERGRQGETALPWVSLYMRLRCG